MENLMRFAARLASLASILIALAAPGAANAGLIVDTYDPTAPVYLNTWNSPFTYQHNLLTHGYVPGTAITNAELDLKLFDTPLTSETLTIRFDGNLAATITNVPFTLFGTEYEAAVQASLLSDGLLNVSISLGCNFNVRGTCILPQDVIFDRSTLTVTTADVPEPASLAVFGAGLLGLAALRRRRA
jgi:hypothetical protein